MTTVITDLRNTIESARRIRYEPASPLTATNVQNAIEQAAATGGGGGGGVLTPTPVDFAMSPYTVLLTDRILLVDTSGGAITINMMAEADRTGLDLEVKDDTGQADVNAISVDMAGAETADGMAIFPIDSSFGRALFTPQAGGYWVK